MLFNRWRKNIVPTQMTEMRTHIQAFVTGTFRYRLRRQYRRKCFRNLCPDT